MDTQWTPESSREPGDSAEWNPSRRCHRSPPSSSSTSTVHDLAFAPQRIETWPLARLVPYAKNAKVHGADQVARIAASLAEFGWTVPCLVGEDGEPIVDYGMRGSPPNRYAQSQAGRACQELTRGDTVPKHPSRQFLTGHSTKSACSTVYPVGRVQLRRADARWSPCFIHPPSCPSSPKKIGAPLCEIRGPDSTIINISASPISRHASLSLFSAFFSTKSKKRSTSPGSGSLPVKLRK